MATLLAALDSAGQTVLLVAEGDRWLGALGARDRARPEALAVLAELRQLGISAIAMLTGDRAAAAATIGNELGIGEVHAELLPEEKAAFLVAWQKDHKVAMVGDGINDAPALAQADVGLAIGGSGADVVAETGDIVLMREALAPLPLLFKLGRATHRTIQQNILVFAFGVNFVGIVVTAWLWPLLAPSREAYDWAPIVAVLYHQLGSLLVLLNSMRLLWFERAPGPRLERWSRRWSRVSIWLEQRLDFDAGLHWLTHHWRAFVGAFLLLGLCAYSFSGLIAIGPDEVAVVRRFGRPIADDLGPGLHWCWPWPIDEVVRLQPNRVRNVEIGFRVLAGSKIEAGARAWSSPHSGEGTRRLPG